MRYDFIQVVCFWSWIQNVFGSTIPHGCTRDVAERISVTKGIPLPVEHGKELIFKV